MLISIYSLPEEGKPWAQCKTGDITDFISYEYEKLFCGVGTFTIEVPVTTIFREMLVVNSILVTDSGDALIVKNIKTTTDKITLTGYDLNGLLLDRVTLAMDSADGTDPVEGSTEACVKYYVENNFVSAEVSGRNLPRFGVAENTLNRGVPNDHAMPRLQNVAELVTEMCNAAGLGWRVSIDKKAATSANDDFLIFDVAEQLDCTANQSERNRVIFSVQQHNISEMTRELGITSAKNVLYCDIGGTVVQYSVDTAQMLTESIGYGRREEYCALSGDSLDPDVYGIEAEQNFSDRMEETNSLTIDAGNPLDYGVLYDVGYIVTAYDRERSVELDSVIAAAKIRRTGSEYSIKLTLGESKPKLLDGYQKKNDATQRTVRSDKADSAAYTTALNFREGGFDLTFNSGGKSVVNKFTVTEDNAGRITQIKNDTAGKVIEVKYE